MNEDKTIKRGELVLLTPGEYSEYRVKLLARAKTAIDIDQILEMYLNQFPDEREAYKFKVSSFIEWLKGLGVIEKLEYREVHTGVHGQADFSLDEY